MTLWHILDELLVATTDTEHNLVSLEIAVNSVGSDEVELTLDMEDWNCNTKLHDQDVDGHIEFIVFPGDKLDWLLSEELVTLCVKLSLGETHEVDVSESAVLDIIIRRREFLGGGDDGLLLEGEESESLPFGLFSHSDSHLLLLLNFVKVLEETLCLLLGQTLLTLSLLFLPSSSLSVFSLGSVSLLSRFPFHLLLPQPLHLLHPEFLLVLELLDTDSFHLLDSEALLADSLLAEALFLVLGTEGGESLSLLFGLTLEAETLKFGFLGQAISLSLLEGQSVLSLPLLILECKSLESELLGLQLFLLLDSLEPTSFLLFPCLSESPLCLLIIVTVLLLSLELHVLEFFVLLDAAGDGDHVWIGELVVGLDVHFDFSDHSPVLVSKEEAKVNDEHGWASTNTRRAMHEHLKLLHVEEVIELDGGLEEVLHIDILIIVIHWRVNNIVNLVIVVKLIEFVATDTSVQHVVVGLEVHDSGHSSSGELVDICVVQGVGAHVDAGLGDLSEEEVSQDISIAKIDLPIDDEDLVGINLLAISLISKLTTVGGRILDIEHPTWISFSRGLPVV